jgi:RNA polymerase sigma-70 factor (ECF subfamily)
VTGVQSSPALLDATGPSAPLDSACDLLDRAMNRYAEGDDSAFAELARELSPRLRGFLRRLTGSPDLTDDLMQETFLRIHRARGSFARDGVVIPWAYAIARNCFISHTRSKKSRFFPNFADVTRVEVATGPDVNPEGSVAALQSAQVVAKTLGEMPVANREAFVLLRYEGLSVASAAQLVGISDAALKLRAFRAYRMLRAALNAAHGVHASE